MGRLVAFAVPALLFSCPCSTVAADELETMLSVVRAAVEEHLGNVSSGKAEFSRNFHQHEGDQKTHISGQMEWEKDYSYFEGTVGEERAENGEQLDVESSVRMVCVDGRHIIRMDTVRTRGALERRSIAFYDVSQLRLTPLSRYFLSHETLAASTDLFLISSPLMQLDQNIANRLSQTVERGESESELLVRTEWPNSDTKELVFDLNQGGMWKLCRSSRKSGGKNTIHEVTRQWEKNLNGCWFPKISRSTSRFGSSTGSLRASTVMEIKSFVPFDRRSVTGKLDVSLFGPVPREARVSVEKSGKIVVVKESDERPEDFGSQLKEISETIRSKGLGAKRQE